MGGQYLDESEEQLIARIRVGDNSAFESLIRRTYDELLGYLVSKTQSVPDAEDILQDVFLRIWRGRESLAIDITLRAYLFTAVRNQLFNSTRGSRRAAATAAEYSAELSKYQSESDLAVQNEIAAAVYSALNSLPERAREVWELHSTQQLTYPEIATVLGVSVNTVKSHMSRAISGLRAALKPLLGLLLIVGL